MLLDSNILIGAAKPDGGALAGYLAHSAACISIVTRIEALGYHQLSQEEEREISLWLAELPELPLDDAVARRAIELRRERKMGLADSIIAATALVREVSLVTSNVEGLQTCPRLATRESLRPRLTHFLSSMLRFSFLPFFAFVAHLALAHAEVDRTTKPEPGPAPEAAFPDYLTKVLPNGLKIFLIEDDRKPTLTLRLLIKAGDARDGDKPGTAGFVAGLLNRGTTTRDAATFARTVDSLGAMLEAGAGPDAISVTTSGLTKITDPLLELFADAVLHPVFAEEEFAKAQRRTYSTLTAQKKEPRSLVGKLMNATLFAGHPYGKYTTPESVKAITRDDLTAFHAKWFAPNNASLAIVGDVKAADILPKIEKVLGGWARKEIPAAGKIAVAPIGGLTIHLLDLPGAVQSSIIVCRGAPSRAGTPELPELNVMNSILGGGFSGRLFQNLREKHGYTYGSSSAFGYNLEAGWFQATAETRNDVTAAAITEILGEINRLAADAVAEPELELQRQYNIGNYLLSLESAARVATRVQDIDLYGLSPDFYKTYARRMATVTPGNVKNLAEKYLSTKDTAIVVVGDAKQIRESLQKLGTIVSYDTDLKVVK